MMAFSPDIGQRLRASGLRVAVTGASGWLGQAALEMLEQALDDEFPARVVAYGSYARSLAMRCGRCIEIAPLAALGSLQAKPTLLLHNAFLTKDRVAGLAPSEYFRLSEEISAAVARAIPGIGVTKMLFPSSGAVYGLPTRPDRSTFDDPDANPYGTQKLRDERCFSDVCAAHGVRLAIPRIFSLSGPFINKHDAYVLASVIKDALAGAPVRLRARRRVVRSYVAVRDLLDATVGWLLAGSEPERVVFDTCGDIVEVGELATKVLQALNREDLRIERPALGPEPDDVYYGGGAEFERLARSQGIRLAPLEQQVSDTAAYLRGLQ
jgi:nucleoside-diphosphate-sugar epimerase